MLYPRGGGEGGLAGHSKGDAVAQVFSISILISVGDDNRNANIYHE